MQRFHLLVGILALGLGALMVACSSAPPPAAAADVSALVPVSEADAYIVQGSDLEAVKAAVEGAGGLITHELRIIKAVGAKLTPAQYAAVAEHDAVTRIYQDRKVGVDTKGDSDGGRPATGARE